MPNRRHYGKPFLSGELLDTTMSVRFKPNKNTVVTAMRTWLIFKNYTAALTNLKGRIYSDRGNLPGELIATSTNSFNKADILDTVGEASGVRSLYFLFDSLGLQKNTYYHLVLHADAYTYDETALIAWRQSWPNPVYPANVSVTFSNLLIYPFDLVVVGDEL